MSSNPRRLKFPKARRLTVTSEFVRVRTQGKSERGRFLILGFLNAGGSEAFRAGFITTKRIGGAVVRNRVRRLLRDIVRKEQARLPAGFWIVVIARPAAARASYPALKDEWLRLAERASILAP